MEVLEVTRTVTCPITDESVEVDNECVLCEYYDGVEGGNIENPGVQCYYVDEE